jgi:phospholipid transport system substrate-binding protein
MLRGRWQAVPLGEPAGQRRVQVMVGRGVVVLAGLLAVTSVGQAADTAPTAVVRQFNDALLSVLKDGEKLGYPGRYQRLQAVMQDTFDLDFMAEKVLGKSWSGLNDADRDRWRQVFSEFTVANYAANFDKFTGQQFEIRGEEPSANETVLVKTLVKSPGHEDVELTYRLHQAGGRWRIMDVFLKGTVSELALRRSDYSSVLERDGFAGLVDVLRSRIADLAAGRAKREQP